MELNFNVTVMTMVLTEVDRLLEPLRLRDRPRVLSFGGSFGFSDVSFTVIVT